MVNLEKIVTRAVMDHTLQCNNTKIKRWTKRWLFGRRDKVSILAARSIAFQNSEDAAYYAISAVFWLYMWIEKNSKNELDAARFCAYLCREYVGHADRIRQRILQGDNNG